MNEGEDTIQGEDTLPAAPVNAELAALAERLERPDPPPGAAPGPGAEGAAPGDEQRTAAAMVAGMVVGIIVKGVASRWPETAYTREEEKAAALVLVPVFVKHGLTPAWLKKWEEEISAAVTLGGMAYVGWQRVQLARAAAAAPKPGAPAE